MLRQLLRAVDAHLTRVAGNTQWRDYALQQFRANAAAQDAQLVQEQLQVARDYTFLINTVAHHRVRLGVVAAWGWHSRCIQHVTAICLPCLPICTSASQQHEMAQLHMLSRAAPAYSWPCCGLV